MSADSPSSGFGLNRRACLATLGAWVVGPLRAGTRGVPSPSWPASLSLDYDVSGQARGLPYRASSRLNWTSGPDGYEAELEMRALLVGTRTQRSRGRLLAHGLRPDGFSDQTRRERRYELDWTRQRYRYLRDGVLSREGDLLPDTQDRLSLFFQLALWATGLTPGTPKGSTTLRVLGQAGVEAWTFRSTALDSVETPAGTLSARRIERQKPEQDDTRMTLWLSERLGHLPARILMEDPNGDVVDQRLRRLP